MAWQTNPLIPLKKTISSKQGVGLTYTYIFACHQHFSNIERHATLKQRFICRLVMFKCTYELLQIVLFLQSVQLVLQLKDQKGTSKAYYVCYGCCFLKIFSAGKDFQDSAASGKSLCSPPVILYKHEIPYLSISSFDSSGGCA